MSVHVKSIFKLTAKGGCIKSENTQLQTEHWGAAKGQGQTLETARSGRGMIMRRMSAVSVLLSAGCKIRERLVFAMFEQTAIMGKCDNVEILERITRPPRQDYF